MYTGIIVARTHSGALEAFMSVYKDNWMANIKNCENSSIVLKKLSHQTAAIGGAVVGIGVRGRVTSSDCSGHEGVGLERHTHLG